MCRSTQSHIILRPLGYVYRLDYQINNSLRQHRRPMFLFQGVRYYSKQNQKINIYVTASNDLPSQFTVTILTFHLKAYNYYCSI